MTIILAILLVVAAIIIWIQKLQIDDLTEELIATDSTHTQLEATSDALSKSNDLMKVSGNSTFYGQIRANTRVLNSIENDRGNEM